MQFILETERLVLREIDHIDTEDLFEMDADPAVHLYIDNEPVNSKEQITDVINMLQQQYKENGVARWAVVHKNTEECMGWAGLKLIEEEMNGFQHFYELGYRFKQKHWGKGYATEASTAIVNYGFENLAIQSIYAITHIQNHNSIKVLTKTGFEFKTVFSHYGEDINWFELHRNALSSNISQ